MELYQASQPYFDWNHGSKSSYCYWQDRTIEAQDVGATCWSALRACEVEPGTWPMKKCDSCWREQRKISAASETPVRFWCAGACENFVHWAQGQLSANPPYCLGEGCRLSAQRSRWWSVAPARRGSNQISRLWWKLYLCNKSRDVRSALSLDERFCHNAALSLAGTEPA